MPIGLPGTVCSFAPCTAFPANLYWDCLSVFEGDYGVKMLVDEAGVMLGGLYNILGGLRVDALWGGYTQDLYESASIDGAGPVRSFTAITMPYMLFVTAPYLITTFVGNINNFNVIYLLTAGNPLTLDYYQAGQTDLLITWLYKLTVNQQDYSLASTIGIFIFIIVATVSLIVYNRTGSVKKEDQFQ